MKYDVDDIKRIDDFIYNFEFQIKELIDNYKYINLDEKEKREMLKVIYILKSKSLMLNKAESKSELKDVFKLNKFLKGDKR